MKHTASDPIRITLPPHFRLTIKLMADNANRILSMLDDLDEQTHGIDSVALTAMIDTIEISTRLARTEIHRALKHHSYSSR